MELIRFMKKTNYHNNLQIADNTIQNKASVRRKQGFTMVAPRDLSKFNKDELREFFDSFDYVLSDCDGVIFIMYKILPGVKESIDALKRIGKKIKFITNNCAFSRKYLAKKVCDQGVKADKDDFINPHTAVIDHLKSINFNKKVFVLSLPSLREELTEAGFQVSNENYKQDWIDIDEAVFLKSINGDDKDVGAVVSCYDFNMTYIDLNKAASYLTNPDVLFLTTGYNQKIIIAPGKYCLGAGFFQDILTEATGKKPLVLGKPSADFGEYIKATMNCKPERTLFIGDSLDHDIGMAKDMGYKTLLVLTGSTKLEKLDNCNPNHIPDYYTNSFGCLHTFIDKL